MTRRVDDAASPRRIDQFYCNMCVLSDYSDLLVLLLLGREAEGHLRHGLGRDSILDH